MRMGRRAAALITAVILAATGCSAPADRPGPASTATASRQTPAEVETTLATLRQVDDLPLYEMTYTGDYDELADIGRQATASPFGCSLFVASADPDAIVFGRNFDWDAHPALLLRTDPPDGYASISMVDVSYLDITRLDTADARRRLLDAPLLPFDGMNERGLAVGLAADESGSLRHDPAKRTVGSVRILRLVLDHAATVEQAIDVIGRYNIDFTGGPTLHYLLADATGASAVVEFVDGDLTVTRGGPPWQAMMNLRIAGGDTPARMRDRRYAIAAETLTAAGGRLSAAAAMALLRAVAQPHTRWSVTYELRTGKITLVTAKRWETVHTFTQPLTAG